MTEARAIAAEDAAAPGEPPRARRRRRQRQLRLVDDLPRPVVKWAGGKTKILRELVGRMPSSFGRYFEPFAGGAALFFRVLPTLAVLGDSNADLIELYDVIAREPVALHDAMRILFERHAADAEGTFYAARDAWNRHRTRWTPLRRAAAFVYLNKACFNGLFRVNRSGEFNAPVGRQAGGPSYPSVAHLLAVQSALRGAVLRCADFVEVVAEAERGDFVYLDPPYPSRGGAANFASYTESGFTAADHEELARHVCALVERGVLVMVSNADVPVVRELYRGLEISAVLSPRSINSNPTGRGKVGELVITGGYDHPIRGKA